MAICFDSTKSPLGEIEMSKTKKFTVKEAAEILGLSVDAVRAHCRMGDCDAEYNEFPSTNRGFYLLTEKSLRWLKENVTARQSRKKTG